MAKGAGAGMRFHNMQSDKKKWAVSVRWFHWSSVALLFLVWLMIALADSDVQGFAFMDWHKALGVSLLFWILARLMNRIISSSVPPISMPKWQHHIAVLTHLALYATLIAMPMAGMLMVMYSGRSISMFGLFEIGGWVTPDRTMSRFFNNLHTDILWPLLLIFMGLHVAGALYHQFVLKDNSILQRMR